MFSDDLIDNTLERILLSSRGIEILSHVLEKYRLDFDGVEVASLEATTDILKKWSCLKDGWGNNEGENDEPN